MLSLTERDRAVVAEVQRHVDRLPEGKNPGPRRQAGALVGTAPGAFERRGQPVFCLALDDVGERPGPLSLGIWSARRRTSAATARV
ncbi:hypothetical protein AB0B07_35330 [Streptomyces sioyaensis]|uniref:hypothetical protein n=1 Tax=Streptomyces sioyaensis TaxID=67364 RepID=UPI0033F9B37B